MSDDVKNGLIIDPAGNKSWWKNDVLHREDGPAVEWTNGHKSWWINGIKINKPKQADGIEQRKIRPCVGLNNEGCPKKHWVVRKARAKLCKDCLKRKREAPKNLNNINMEKLNKYLKEHPRPKYLNLKYFD